MADSKKPAPGTKQISMVKGAGKKNADGQFGKKPPAPTSDTPI